MGDLKKHFYFDFAKVTIEYFYIYFVIAILIAGYLTYKSASKHKIPLFFMSFYLLTGNLHYLLIIKIPGFDIQPLRLVYLLLAYELVKKTFFSKNFQSISSKNTTPLYQIALVGYLIFMAISVMVNVFPAKVGVIIDGIAFILIIKGVGILADRAFYSLIGKCIIIAAVFSSIVSILQLVYDPYFMRIGSPRTAFGDVLRSNGLFSQEYNNSYFLIIAIIWVLTVVKKELDKIGLVVLFSIGVLCSFMRMSWLILALVLITYLIYVRKTAIEKLLLAGLIIFAIGITTSITYYQEIMNSKLVKERLSDGIDSRKGYYKMVLDNFGNRPLVGYGDRNNEVYYSNMLAVTGSRVRASGAEGGIHNGYLEVLFYYGLPALVFFVLYMILSVIYHASFIRENTFFTIPFLIGIIVLVGNFTNSFPLLSYPSTLYAIHIGIGIGYKKLENRSFNQKELTPN